MSFFSRHRRLPSFDKENVEHDHCYTAIEADVCLSPSAPIGLSINSQNMITRIDNLSPVARKFRVGATIVAVNGREAASMSVAAMLEDAALSDAGASGNSELSITVMRKN